MSNEEEKMDAKEIVSDFSGAALDYACSAEDDRIVEAKKNFVLNKLDILELLKSSIYRYDIHKYVLKEELRGQNFMILSIHINGNENIDKIEEWMKNE